MKKIMVVTNNPQSLWLPVLQEAVQSLGIVVPVTMEEVRERLQKEAFALIIADMSEIMDEVAYLVKKIRSLQPAAPIFVVTTSPTWRRAREALLAGAADYDRRTFDKENLLLKCRTILQQWSTDPP